MAIGTPVSIGTNYVSNSTANQPCTVSGGGAAIGDTVIVVVANDGGGIPTGVTDSKGNTYTADHAGLHDADDFSARIFSSRLTTALVNGDTVTAAHGTSGTWDRHLTLAKVSGLLTTTGWVDKTVSATGTTGTTGNSGNTATTTQANELVFGFVVNGGSSGISGTFTAGASLTLLYNNATSSGFCDLTTAYRIVSSTGVYSVSASWSAASDRWGAVAVTYKEAAAADSTPPITTVTSGTAKISDETGKDSYAYSFQANEACQAWKIKVVADAGDLHTSGAQVESGGAISANTTVSGSITYAELNAAGEGAEGAKILKFFSQDLAGNWST